MQVRGDNAWFFGLPQQYRARAIAKNNDCAAIGWIAGTRQHISTDHQRIFYGTRFNILIGDAQRIGETRARRCNIKCRAAFDAEHVLHLARCAWEGMRGRCCRHHNKPDLFFINASHLKRSLSGFVAHGGHSFVWRGDTTFTDTCARDNPLVRRIYHFFKIGVGTHLFWQVAAGT